MESYRVSVLNKGSTEYNIARVLQPIDISESDVFIEEVTRETAKVAHEGPIKSEGRVTSRKTTEDLHKPPEYIMKATNKRLKTFKWNGVSEETGRYAVLINDRDELKLILSDHWYKFTRVQEMASTEPVKEVKLMSRREREKRRDEQVVRDLLGDDSEEDVVKTKKKPKVAASDEEDSGKEGMDFVEEFTDDEDSKASSDESQVAVSKAARLSNSGKEIKRALGSDSDDIDSVGSDIGLQLSDEEPQLLKLTKDAIVNELMRLGRVTMNDFVSGCKGKFKTEDKNWIGDMKKILSEVADLVPEGNEKYLLLKEAFKRSVPRHGKRMYFQKLQK